jgi:hypothetical protein
MVKVAHLRCRHDTPGRWRHDRSCNGRVLAKRKVCSHPHIVRNVVCDQPVQPERVHDDDVIWFVWFLRNVRHACEGGRGGRRMYLATVD